MINLKSIMDEILLEEGYEQDKWLYDKGERVVCVQYVNHLLKSIINHSVNFRGEDFDFDRKLEDLLPGYKILRVIFQWHEDASDMKNLLQNHIYERQYNIGEDE